MRTSSMRHRARWIAAAAAVAAVPALAVPIMAASPAAASARPAGSYRLSLAPVDGRAAKTATLTCTPDGGSHSAAVAACDQLRTANGRIGAIPEEAGPCTLEYAPVQVTARGHWNGGYRWYQETYPNRCAAVRATGGAVFNF